MNEVVTEFGNQGQNTEILHYLRLSMGIKYTMVRKRTFLLEIILAGYK